MLSSVNLQEVKEKLIEKLNDTGWDQHLKMFLIGTEFDNILIKLLEEAQDGRRFTPQLKYLFSAFEKCPLNKVRVVLIGQD